MIALLDLQHAMRRGILGEDDAEIARYVIGDGIAPDARVGIYRNSVIAGLTNALRLSFPVVQSLVGDAFFETAARIFIQDNPPDRAWLDTYGDRFPAFLDGFEPAAAVPYLADVARLEWAVNVALHAVDAPKLDVLALRHVPAEAQDWIAFGAHPSISLLESAYPVDAIWRAVLNKDDAAMAAIDLASGPARLMIERGEEDVSVIGCDPKAWRFAKDLFAGERLSVAFAGLEPVEATYLLAGHLSAGRFSHFSIVPELA